MARPVETLCFAPNGDRPMVSPAFTVNVDWGQCTSDGTVAYPRIEPNNGPRRALVGWNDVACRFSIVSHGEGE